MPLSVVLPELIWRVNEIFCSAKPASAGICFSKRE
ncbi:Uncharacterised protein [Shigella sonnei]|nr:Uncharacterised protein [Shigella sonnei]